MSNYLLMTSTERLLDAEGRELREQITKLRAALAPFAAFAKETRRQGLADDDHLSVHRFQAKHFRAAQAAMEAGDA